MTSQTITGVKTSEEVAASTLTGAELVRIVQGGESRRTTAGAVAELAGGARSISLRTRGVNGTGTVDARPAIQAIIDELAALGGGVVDCSGGRWLIDSADLIVKQGVTLWGPWLNLGEPDGQDYRNIQSAFIVNPAYTIRLAQEFAAIKGLGIFRKGLTTPQTAAEALAEIASFAGKAITVGYALTSKDACDTYVGYCHILGFEYAYYCDWNERPRIEYVSGDCTNGIYLKRCYDMNHLHKCHFWPFVTAHKPWTLTQDIWRRQGVAYNFDTDTDWGQATDCFQYGYDTGFRINQCSNGVLLNCGSDNWRDGNTYTVGFLVVGNSQNVNIIGCKSAAQNFGMQVNPSGATAQNVKIIGGNVWGCEATTGRGIVVTTGSAVISGVSFFDAPTGLQTDATAGAVSIDDCVFNSITTPYSIANENNVQIGGNNLYPGTVVESTFGRRYVTDGSATSFEAGFSNTASPGLTARRARGTRASPAIVQTSDTLHTAACQAWDGAAWVEAARCRVQVEGAPASGNVGGTIVWATRNAAGTYADRLAISREGQFYPLTDAVNDLGTASLRWNNIFAANARVNAMPVFANEAAAVAGGLVTGQLYRTAGGEVRVKL